MNDEKMIFNLNADPLKLPLSCLLDWKFLSVNILDKLHQ